MFQILRYLSQSLSFTLMSMDNWKVFQTIIVTHPTNFALVKIALNQLHWGPDGPDTPNGASDVGVHLVSALRIGLSSGGQDEAIHTPNVLLGALAWPVLSCTTAF